MLGTKIFEINNRKVIVRKRYYSRDEKPYVLKMRVEGDDGMEVFLGISNKTESECDRLYRDCDKEFVEMIINNCIDKKMKVWETN